MRTPEWPSMLTPRDRRALRLLGVALSLSLCTRLGAVPWLKAERSMRTDLEYERHMLARERSILAEARNYESVFASARDYLVEAAPRLLVAQSEAEAASVFYAYLEQQAEAAGGVLVSQIRSADAGAVRPGTESDTARQIVQPLALHVVGEGDLEGLLTFLRFLETGPRIVALSELEIANRSPPRDATPEVLSFGFRATALYFARGSFQGDSARAAAGPSAADRREAKRGR